MPPDTAASIWTRLIDQGPLVIVLAVGAVWLARKVGEHITQQTQNQKELITALNAEREERLAVIEKRAEDCEQDRKRLWEHLLSMKLAIALLSVLCSCTVNPTLYTDTKGRMVATLGGSALSKAGYEAASITLPDGAVLSMTRHGKDETRIPISQAQLGLAEMGVKAAAGVVRAAK